VEIEHSEKLIELKTTEMANEDLNTYYAALDHAIMKFHSLKMEEINKTIKELWISTYQGNDIDYIEIRTDVETEGGSKNDASTKRKSYNYRVSVLATGECGSSKYHHSAYITCSPYQLAPGGDDEGGTRSGYAWTLQRRSKG